MKLEIECAKRPNNAEMFAFSGLITLITGDADREIEWEQGGVILRLEGSDAELSQLKEALETGRHSPVETCNNPYFRIGLRTAGGPAEWKRAIENFRALCTKLHIS